MKDFLTREGLEFEVKDIHSDADAMREMVDMGIMSIPVTIVGDSAPIVGARFDDIKAAL